MNVRARILPIVALLLGPTIALAQLPPDKAIADLKVAPGLQVELFASELDGFVNPTSIDVDEAGRVWVCEAVNYRRKLRGQPPLRKEGDRIVVVIDSNGDGKADRSQTFYQGPEIMAPLGVAVAKDADGPGYQVYMCQSPDIWVFTDKDGDLKADGPGKKLLSGFGGVDHDHGVHGVTIGPDGKLYFTVGDSGVNGLQGADGKGRKWSSNGTDCRAGTVWRCDRDGGNLELIAHNFRNNYEACVDSFGSVFLSDNDDDGNQQTRICFVMPGGNYGYHPRGAGQTHWHEEQPGVVHKIIRTGFGSPTGICMYEGDLLPAKYRGQLLHTDAGPRELRAFHLKVNGAAYDVEKEVLLTSIKDSWFRLADVCVAPDGSLICADWYDPGVGGHGMGDTTRGRLYRITPVGHKGYTIPKLDLASKAGILAALGSPNLASRAAAIAKLDRMPAQDALAILVDGLDRKNPTLAARAYWQAFARIDRMNQQQSNQLTAFMNAKEDRERFEPLMVRVQKSRSGISLGNDNDAGKRVQASLATRSLAAWREELVSMRGGKVELIREVFYPLAKLYDGKDIFYRAALNIALGDDPEVRKLVLADFDKHFPEWNDTVADLVWELRPASVMPRLETLLADAKLSAAQRGRIVDILSSNDDIAAGKSMLRLLSTDVPAEVRERILANLITFLPGKWQALRKSEDMAKAIETLMNQPTGRASALVLIGVADRPSDVNRVKVLAADPSTDNALRLQAIRTLGQLPAAEAVDALASLSMEKSSPTTLAAIDALGALIPMRKETPVAKKALDVLTKLVQDRAIAPESKRAAVSALTISQPGTMWLLETHKKGELPSELVADAGKLLRNSPFQGLRNQAMLTFPPPGRLDPKKLPSIAELAKRKGDAKKGQAVLLASLKGESQCLRCHMVRGNGGQIGPDLSMIGKKASRENLIESILVPSKAIADQYINWQVETKQGQVITGLLVEETPDVLTLRDANGRDNKIAKKDIDERSKTTVSIMPENLVAAMTEDDLLDLVEYMLTLTTPSLVPDRWQIVGPFPAGESPLDTPHGPEKDGKVDLSASYMGKGGTVKWKTVRPGEGGYVDLQAFYAPDSNQIVSYLALEVDSPAEQEALVLLGTDDGGKLFVNGKEVWAKQITRAAAPEQERITVKLAKGKNTIMLKIANGDGGHGLYFTLISEQELKPAQVAAK